MISCNRTTGDLSLSRSLTYCALFIFLQSPLKPLQQIQQTSLQDSESAPPSRATDVPSTLKDSGYGDIANESSRNLSPEDEPQRIPGFG